MVIIQSSVFFLSSSRSLFIPQLYHLLTLQPVGLPPWPFITQFLKDHF
jgi:hypothetical protein